MPVPKMAAGETEARRRRSGPALWRGRREDPPAAARGSRTLFPRERSLPGAAPSALEWGQGSSRVQALNGLVKQESAAPAHLAERWADLSVH